MSARSALVEYRDDGPLAALFGRIVGQRGGGRTPIDPALLTLAGALPAGVLAALPARSRPALGVGLGWLVCCAGVGAGRPLDTRLGWLVPPLLRTAEYGLLLRMAVLDGGRLDGGRLGRCYAFLAALAYHHYDVVYRIRTRGIPPPTWLRLAGGGWEIRLLAAYGLHLRGRLLPAMGLVAPVLGGLFVAESVRSWMPGSGAQAQRAARNSGPDQPALYQDGEADDE